MITSLKGKYSIYSCKYISVQYYSTLSRKQKILNSENTSTFKGKCLFKHKTFFCQKNSIRSLHHCVLLKIEIRIKFLNWQHDFK